MDLGSALFAAGGAGTDGACGIDGTAPAMATAYTDYCRFHHQCAYADFFLRALLPGSRRPHVSDAARVWNPRYAPALRIWGAAWRETADAYRNADQVGTFVRQAGKVPIAASIERSRTLRVVNLWWWMLPAVGIPRIAGAAVSLALLVVGLWVIARALARAPEDDGALLSSQLLPGAGGGGTERSLDGG